MPPSTYYRENSMEPQFSTKESLLSVPLPFNSLVKMNRIPALC